MGIEGVSVAAGAAILQWSPSAVVLPAAALVAAVAAAFRAGTTC